MRSRSEVMWVEKRIEWVGSTMKSRRTSRMSRRATGSMPLVGSSSTRSSGSWASARASESLRPSPRERSLTRVCMGTSKRVSSVVKVCVFQVG